MVIYILILYLWPMKDIWFKDWFNSPYYHQLYQNRDEKEAAEFINRLIKFLSPSPHAFMLDIACGKGRHALQLAEKGFDVTGIDLSEQSIEEALKVEKENLHFYQHDMRMPFWINYFDFVFNFFTSFGYFDSDRENDNTIRTFAQALKPKGILVMDYLNVSFEENRMEHLTKKVIDNSTFTVTKWYDDHFFYKKIIIEELNIDVPIIHTEKVSKFSLADFTSLFEAHGLKIKNVFGNYTLDAYDAEKSSRLIMVAEKI